MTASPIKVRTAIACEDLRHEADGKPFAIGIMNPIIGRRPPRSDGTWPALKLAFLLSLDVRDTGEFELQFRLRPSSGDGGGSLTKMKVAFLEAADHMPFPVGPMQVALGAEDHEFVLEHLTGPNQWQQVATWRIEDRPASLEAPD